MAERSVSAKMVILVIQVLVNAGQYLTNGTTCYPNHGDAEPGRSLATYPKKQRSADCIRSEMICMVWFTGGNIRNVSQ
ncbi:uncharacterized protein EURHEDRAFT_415527 [Aspergillus ruber CBS 135680]|uniref:Secreted protein n=1 Tax=Aspergillus ruber (strain CBS 135680) TaxID=1388766 RepID=A0A017S706_ASPRC|nr:uncharacterized protein EURHEDRAFT_415527 [Aspergillus ruber CBS 135680]EYE92404.1 hypothetical protein EURHEDRAFT_415527 [Aspergillus ruber CBS 135680]